MRRLHQSTEKNITFAGQRKKIRSMKTLVHQGQLFIEEVLKAAKICFVGMADTDGTPYVIPMNFGYRDGAFYLHSAQEGRSISILSRNPRVCISVSVDNSLVFQHPEVACSYRMKAKSVIAWGKVVYEEEDERKREALDIIMEQYVDKAFRYSDPAVRNVKIWRVAVEEITCKEFGAPHRKP